MNILETTLFFQNLTIVVGIIYALSAVMVLFASDFMVSIQKRFVSFDDETIKRFLYGYVALFKIFLIVFIIGPYIALLMMS